MRERTTDRRSVRAGDGEYDRRDDPDRSISVAWERWQFLNAATELEPQILKGLQELAHTARSSEGHRRAAAKLMRRFNLGDRWCCEQDTRELLMVVASRGGKRVLKDGEEWEFVAHPEAPLRSFGYDFAGPRHAELPAPANAPTSSGIASLRRRISSLMAVYRKLRWDPRFETRAAAERRYREYLDRIEELFQKAGFKRTPERRQPEHFRWLAAYQVLRFSYNRMSEALSRPHYTLPRHTLELAIKRRAREIGLTLRSPVLSRRATLDEIRSALTPHKP